MQRIFLLDMDGVVADFDKKLYQLWSNLFPERVLTPRDKRTQWDIAHEHPEWDEDLNTLIRGRNYAIDLDPVPGAIEGINLLVEKGHQVFFCTAPLITSPTNFQDKAEWIRLHFGSDWVRRLCVVKDKTLVRGHYLIDDRPVVEGAMRPEWIHVVFDAPYNRNAGDNPRLKGWENLATLLSYLQYR